MTAPTIKTERQVVTNYQSGDTSNTSVTLRQLLNIALPLLPTHDNVLQQMFKYPAVIDIAFSGFELDSRQLENTNHSSSELSSSQLLKPGFILLKSQTQPLDKSCAYAKEASKHAAFILTELTSDQLDAAQPNDEQNTYSGQTEIGDRSGYSCPVISVPNIRDVLGTLIQLSLLTDEQRNTIKALDDLANTLPKVIAVTGTNGKTTITQLVAQLCQTNERATAVMGTAGNGRLGHLKQASHTTGDALAVQTFLHQMAEENVDILALEASSHGLDQQRLQGVPVKVAIYTNLSRDHLDYHSNMEAYANAKARLFDRRYFPTLSHAIINLDDEFASLMLETASDSGLEVWTYSIDASKSATFKAAQINPSLNGAEIELKTDFGTIWLNSPLLGRFNVSNLLAAVAGAMTMGIALTDMPSLVEKLKGADGRMQRIVDDNNPPQSTQSSSQLNQGVFIVDYAHTPDALTQVLTSLRPHCSGKLWAVFGCGGDRDRGKRPLMAQAGLNVADSVILTSDNPRSEDPIQILEDMQQGITEQQRAKTRVIADRREAINHVVKLAGNEDIVVIAGKGHETYQEIKGVRHDFDDRRVLQEAFRQTKPKTI